MPNHVIKKHSEVLTKEQAEKSLEGFRRKSLITWTDADSELFLFVDTYKTPAGLDTENLVICEVNLPMTAAKREGLENGIIDTVDKYIFIFQDKDKLCESIAEYEERNKAYSEVN